MKKIIQILFIFPLFLMTLTSEVVAQEPLNIAIVQLISHPSLDDIVSGIYEGLETNGYVEGENLKVDFQNAEGDLNLLSTISEQVVSQNPDLIFAVTTPVAQSLQNTTSEIPIILAGITDPVSANIVDSIEKPGGNITGVSDKVSHESQFDLIKKVLPELKKVGMLYTTSEDNSENEMNEAKAVAESLGYEVVLEGISSTLDIQMVGENLASQVDAIYIGSDNTIASALGNLLDITDQAGIPVLTTVDNFVGEGALSALAINQKEIGILAAQEALKVVDGSIPSDQPIAFLEDLQGVINYEVADRLGIKISEEVQADLLDINEYMNKE